MVTRKKDTALQIKFENQSKLFKKFRSRLSLTQKDLSKKTGINVQYVSNIERGTCGISAKTAKALIKLGLEKDLISKAYSKDVLNIYTNQIG